MNNVCITKKEANNALLRSGYLLEGRLETVLRSRGYYVEANAAYPDPVTGKSRELDLLAGLVRFLSKKGISTVSRGDISTVGMRLLIECVNNPQPIVFIAKEPQRNRDHSMEIKLAGLPVQVPVKYSEEDERDTWIYLPLFLKMKEYHHYCNGRFSTQYCSFNKKEGREK